MADSFVFYRTFKDTADSLPIEKRLAFYEAVVDYGLNGKYDDSDPWIDSLMQQTMNSIDRAQERYKNAKKGGAKRKYDHREMYELFMEGKTKQEVADITGASVKTVDRAIKEFS